MPKTSVRHIFKMKLDHRPIVISTSTDNDTKDVKHFRFLANWLLRPNFPNMVKRAWNLNDDISEKLIKATSSIKY